MSSSRGNAGEHLVMAALLVQDFEACRADRGNPNYDVACYWNATGRSTRLRVKTASNGNAVWTAKNAKKKTGVLFGDILPKDDVVVICDLTAGIPGAQFYIVPIPIIDRHLADNRAHYVGLPGRNGKPRKAENTLATRRQSQLRLRREVCPISQQLESVEVGHTAVGPTLEQTLVADQTKHVSRSTGCHRWYSWVGSNHRPPVPQTGALTN